MDKQKNNIHIKEESFMRRIIALCMAFVMCFMFCSCGELTLEKAVNKADKLVKKFDKKEVANCTYEGKYISNFDDEGTNMYKVVAKVIDDSEDFNTVVSKIKSDVSPKLEKLFSNLYCTVLITINGYRDGEIEMLLNGKTINQWIG